MRILIILSIIFIDNILFTASINASNLKKTEDIKKTNLLKQIFLHLEKKNWAKCQQLTKQKGGTTIQKIIKTQEFLDPKNKNNSFEAIITFIKKNPYWINDKLKFKAEELLNYETKRSVILDWFKTNTPLTNKGYKFHAIANAIVAKGDYSKIKQIIKNGWIYGDFTKEEADKYINQFKEILSEKDHVKKIDMLLFKGKIKNAKKYLLYIKDTNYKKNFFLQESIILRNFNTEKIQYLFKKIPQIYYTEGLLYNFLISQKNIPPKDQIVSLFKKIKATKSHSQEWQLLQSFYAREFMYYNNYQNSYEIISLELATNDEEIREIQWLSGWISLRFLKNTNLALKHFTKFMKVVKKPMSLARGLYWLGRTYEQTGDYQNANEYYKKASQYNYTFYGQISNITVNKNRIILPKKLYIPPDIKSKDVYKLVKALKYLVQYQKYDLALEYAKHAIKIYNDPILITLIVEIINNHFILHNKVEISKIASQYKTFIREHAFPTPYINIIKQTQIEKALIFSIIRQESVFNPNVISSANAIGLMQLIEKTACSTAKNINQKCKIEKLTSDPIYNITLGEAYLKELLDKFNNSYILAIISYNAGIQKTKKWIELLGDPRRIKNLHEIIDWIELIPYAETRNYLQRVLENLQIYRIIIDKNNTLKLENDLLPKN